MSFSLKSFFSEKKIYVSEESSEKRIVKNNSDGEFPVKINISIFDDSIVTYSAHGRIFSGADKEHL